MLQYGRQATNPPYNHVHQIMIECFPTSPRIVLRANTGPFAVESRPDVGCRSPAPYHQ